MLNNSRTLSAACGLAVVLAWFLTAPGGETVAVPQAQTVTQDSRPNIVVMLVDDMGYGDVGIHGHPTIRTPNIDAMARDGIKLTSLYTAPNCTPTRGMLLTGRYPIRTGLLSPTGPGHASGMRDDEITLAEALKALGYRTAMFGKWHLGDFEATPAFNPTAHGFDEFVGIPYSHDYNPPNGVPLFHNTTVAEQPVVPGLMTKRFTDGAVRFIRESGRQPFFVYVAHPMPHVPVAVSPAFEGRSKAGRYGDTIEELDWSVGEIGRALRELKLDRNTITVFLSDNGPWVAVAEQTYDRAERGDKVQGDVGWSGPFRASKSTTYEGGVRVPALVTWPAAIPGGQVSSEIVSVMDLYPTFIRAAGGQVRTDRPVDGVDMLPLLRGTSPGSRHEVFMFLGASLQAVRQEAWKLRLGPAEGAGRQGGRGGRGAGAADGAGRSAAAPPPTPPTPEPELFNLEMDPAERHNVAASHPAVVERLRARMDAMLADVVGGSRSE